MLTTGRHSPFCHLNPRSFGLRSLELTMRPFILLTPLVLLGGLTLPAYAGTITIEGQGRSHRRAGHGHDQFGRHHPGRYGARPRGLFRGAPTVRQWSQRSVTRPADRYDAGANGPAGRPRGPGEIRRPRGRSGLRRAGWWVTPTRGDPRDSATEKRPPLSPRGESGKGETVEQETTSTPGDRRGSANPARSKIRQRTLEGCSPECAGGSLEAVGNGGRRWMVAPALP